MFLGLHASRSGIMLDAEPPAPKIKTFAEVIKHLSFKSSTKPMPSVESANISS